MPKSFVNPILVLFMVVFILQKTVFKTPEDKEILHITIQHFATRADTLFPHVSTGFVILTIFLCSLLYAIVTKKRWSYISAKGSVSNAKRVASRLWYVETLMTEEDHLEKDHLVIRFRYVYWNRWSFILEVLPKHPDIEKFCHLKNGEIVQFESLDQCMKCTLKRELCGYLRIKDIT